MENALAEATPGIKSKPQQQRSNSKRKASPWWDEECDKWIRLRKAALLKFHNTGLFEHFIEYKKKVSIARKELKRIKKNSFKRLCEGMRRDVNPVFVWKTVRKFQSRWNRTEKEREYRPEKIQQVKKTDSLFIPTMDTAT